MEPNTPTSRFPQEDLDPPIGKNSTSNSFTVYLRDQISAAPPQVHSEHERLFVENLPNGAPGSRTLNTEQYLYSAAHQSSPLRALSKYEPIIAFQAAADDQIANTNGGIRAVPVGAFYSAKKKPNNQVQAQAIENPDLYGLRRSQRVRASSSQYATEDLDDGESESDIQPRSRRRGIPPVEGVEDSYLRQGRNRNSYKSEDLTDFVMDNSDETASNGSSDSWDDYERPVRRKKRRRKSDGIAPRIKKTAVRPIRPPAVPIRFSTRNKAHVNYADELGSDEDEFGQKYKHITAQVYVDPNEPVIDLVLDHRTITAIAEDGTVDETMPPVLELLVKWRGKSHMHNSWQPEKSLESTKGFKKVQNYIRATTIEDVAGIGDDEEQEGQNIERELKRSILNDYTVVERVLAFRSDSLGSLEYLCKWGRLEYKESTWEPAELISKYQVEIDAFYELEIGHRTPSTSKVYTIFNRPTWLSKVQPPYVIGGTLREYQLIGTSWMLRLWSQNQNGILADEMGLGKTVQTITFLNILSSEFEVHGPFLIVVPLSVMHNWQCEFRKWAPQMNVISYIGGRESRKIIQEHEFFLGSRGGRKRNLKFNVLLTTYEIVLKDQNFLRQFKWTFLAVDEAHRLKNSASQLHEALKTFPTVNRLLITGTPLQNSVRELNSLIQFLMPDEFADLEEFDIEGVEEEKIVELQRRVRPLMLRRLKCDVETTLPSKNERILLVDLVPLQLYYYKHIMLRNYSVLNRGVSHGQVSLLNILVELKKASNHPFLFPNAQEHFVEQMPETASGDTLRGLIAASGKMLLLDKLLIRLKAGGHRVLIFSQMVRMLDILTDYMFLRGYRFQRLDGSVNAEQRKRAIEHFNAPDSVDFCFLLSTRAGGLGLNLTSADTVIIFDSDWNPQNDLQAMARAHRIGQTKQVNVYRIVSKDSVEESIIERAKKKMVLEYCIIKHMDTSGREGPLVGKSGSEKFSKDDLNEILRFGAKNMFERDVGKDQPADVDLDDILARAEEREMMEKKKQASKEFLNQFQVTEFGYNQLSWEDIIPEADRRALEEEQKRQEELQRRQQEDAMVMRKYKKSMTNGGGELGVSLRDFEPAVVSSQPRRHRRATQAAASSGIAISDGSSGDVLAGLQLSDKEVRNLSRALCKFGDTDTRMEDIIRDAGLSQKPAEEVAAVVRDMVAACKTAVVFATGVLDDGAAAPRHGRAVSIAFRDVQLNATHLVNRVRDLTVLNRFFVGMKVTSSFRLGSTIRPVINWTCSWSTRDDSLLVLGLYRHGFGNWEQIRSDADLGLTEKIFLSESEREKTPRHEHLVRRAEALVKMVVDKIGQQNVPSQKPIKERLWPTTSALATRSLSRRSRTLEISRPVSADREFGVLGGEVSSELSDVVEIASDEETTVQAQTLVESPHARQKLIAAAAVPLRKSARKTQRASATRRKSPTRSRSSNVAAAPADSRKPAGRAFALPKSASSGSRFTRSAPQRPQPLRLQHKKKQGAQPSDVLWNAAECNSSGSEAGIRKSPAVYLDSGRSENNPTRSRPKRNIKVDRSNWCDNDHDHEAVSLDRDSQSCSAYAQEGDPRSSPLSSLDSVPPLDHEVRENEQSVGLPPYSNFTPATPTVIVEPRAPGLTTTCRTPDDSVVDGEEGGGDVNWDQVMAPVLHALHMVRHANESGDPAAKVRRTARGLLQVGAHIDFLLQRGDPSLPSEEKLWRYVARSFAKRPQWQVPQALYYRILERERSSTHVAHTPPPQ